jgi:amino acid adenylation domain-containing protein
LQVVFPDDVRVDELVTAQAARSPEAVAVVAGEVTVSYAELETRANRLAHHLVSLGVAPGDLVGVAVERGVEMVVAVLATLKCGAAYVPLDPAFPAERLTFMVTDTGLSVIITSTGALPDSFDTTALTVIDVDVDADTIAAAAAGPVGVVGGELAYVIYTSGSTGVPKGVQVTHGNVVNLLTSMQSSPGFDGDDVLVAVTTLSFDISVLELFLPLISGGRLVVATGDQTGDGQALARLIGSSQATVVQATPTTWTMLFEAGWHGDPQLTVLCGGEALSTHLAEQLVNRCGAVWNMFGPTETTIWSTVHHVTVDDLAGVAVPIGRPIANTVCRVLDRSGGLCPVGVPGELHIGGVGVTAGY